MQTHTRFEPHRWVVLALVGVAQLMVVLDLTVVNIALPSAQRMPAWPLGAWVCLAIARGWPQGRMRRAALIVVWFGCAVLVARGGAGLIDDLTRAVGLLPNGITGLSHKQTMGAAYYRSASVLWSNNIIDGYFFAGGLLFGLLAHRYLPTASSKGG